MTRCGPTACSAGRVCCRGALTCRRVRQAASAAAEREALHQAERDLAGKMQRTAAQYRSQVRRQRARAAPPARGGPLRVSCAAPQIKAAQKAEKKGKTGDALGLYEEVTVGYEAAGLKAPTSLMEQVHSCQHRLAEEMEAKDQREGRLTRGQSPARRRLPPVAPNGRAAQSRAARAALARLKKQEIAMALSRWVSFVDTVREDRLLAEVPLPAAAAAAAAPRPQLLRSAAACPVASR